MASSREKYKSYWKKKSHHKKRRKASAKTVMSFCVTTVYSEGAVAVLKPPSSLFWTKTSKLSLTRVNEYCTRHSLPFRAIFRLQSHSFKTPVVFQQRFQTSGIHHMRRHCLWFVFETSANRVFSHFRFKVRLEWPYPLLNGNLHGDTFNHQQRLLFTWHNLAN